MGKTVVIQPDHAIKTGDSFHVMSDHLKVGDSVEICRTLGGFIGKPIASGKVVANGSQDPRAKVAHSQNGNARAWKKYWKILVTKG